MTAGRFIETPVNFESEGLRLEGALQEGDGSLSAVVLHPHPQYGGDMDSHVVMALCRAAADEGATTLRFNFRGVGRSEGSFDSGRGEAADTCAAVDYLRSGRTAVPLVLAGYSFGAAMAASVAGAVSPTALVLVSLPGQAAAGSLPDDTPTLIVTGERDEIARPVQLRRFEGPNRQVVIIEGVDHFWWLGSDRLAATVRSFIGNLQARQ